MFNALILRYSHVLFVRWIILRRRLSVFDVAQPQILVLGAVFEVDGLTGKLQALCVRRVSYWNILAESSGCEVVIEQAVRIMLLVERVLLCFFVFQLGEEALVRVGSEGHGLEALELVLVDSEEASVRRDLDLAVIHEAQLAALLQTLGALGLFAAPARRVHRASGV